MPERNGETETLDGRSGRSDLPNERDYETGAENSTVNGPSAECTTERSDARRRHVRIDESRNEVFEVPPRDEPIAGRTRSKNPFPADTPNVLPNELENEVLEVPPRDTPTVYEVPPRDAPIAGRTRSKDPFPANLPNVLPSELERSPQLRRQLTEARERAREHGTRDGDDTDETRGEETQNRRGRGRTCDILRVADQPTPKPPWDGTATRDSFCGQCKGDCNCAPVSTGSKKSQKHRGIINLKNQKIRRIYNLFTRIS